MRSPDEVADISAAAGERRISAVAERRISAAVERPISAAAERPISVVAERPILAEAERLISPVAEVPARWARPISAAVPLTLLAVGPMSGADRVQAERPTSAAARGSEAFMPEAERDSAAGRPRRTSRHTRVTAVGTRLPATAADSFALRNPTQTETFASTAIATRQGLVQAGLKPIDWRM